MVAKSNRNIRLYVNSTGCRVELSYQGMLILHREIGNMSIRTRDGEKQKHLLDLYNQLDQAIETGKTPVFDVG